LSNWLFGILRGLVQGIAEWLPISSKTQIIIVSTYLYGFSFQRAYAFGLFLEAATFVAALIYFRGEVLEVLRALVGRGGAEGRLLLKYLVVVTIITALIGGTIYALVETVSGPVVGVPMLILGAILIGDAALIHFARGRRTPEKRLDQLALSDLVIIGIAQGLAALPGVSRSGATVSAMLLLGLNPREAFRLSFLALMPAAVGASLLTLIFSKVEISGAVSAITPAALGVATVVAILASLLLIRALLRAADSARITILVAGLGLLAILSGVATLLVGSG